MDQENEIQAETSALETDDDTGFLYPFPIPRTTCEYPCIPDGPYLPQDDGSSSVSSNETAADIAGPGRLLGNAYSHYGRKVERGLGRLFAAVKRTNELENDSNAASLNMSNIIIYGAQQCPYSCSAPCQHRNENLTKASTTETASNLIGPGRIIGKIYSYYGRRIERGMGRLADRLGFGPRATYDAIWSIFPEPDEILGIPQKRLPAISNLIKRLLRYTLLSIYTFTIAVLFMNSAHLGRKRDILRLKHSTIYGAWLFTSSPITFDIF